jgi:CheY-like chemotaxis protein
LVITDLTMPGMNGIELANALHEIRPELPIILASGFGGMRTANFAQWSGSARGPAKAVHSGGARPLGASNTGQFPQD